MRATPWLFLGLASVTFGTLGCSSTSTAGASTSTGNPTMTGMVFPATCSIGDDGTYDMTGTVSFSDTESLVSEINIVSMALSYSHQIGIQGTNSVNKGTITVQFPSNFGSGTVADYEISVTDESGTTSAALTGSVTLE